jgi:hypothetical protein
MPDQPPAGLEEPLLEARQGPVITPKFFLQWFWRLHALLGLTNVWLAAGSLGRARSDADRFLASALSTAEPNVHALGWDAQARVSMAEKDWQGADRDIERGLAVLERFDVPTVAWRLHATRSELYRRSRNGDAAEVHRARAERVIQSLANSFEPDEPLRSSFLAAGPVRRLLKPRRPGGGVRERR